MSNKLALPRPIGAAVQAILSLKLLPGAGQARARTAALPRLHLRLAASRSQKLDVRLSSRVRQLLDRGRATVRTKASWSSGGRQGKAGTSAKLR
jgi:hypothetical protein